MCNTRVECWYELCRFYEKIKDPSKKRKFSRRGLCTLNEITIDTDATCSTYDYTDEWNTQRHEMMIKELEESGYNVIKRD